MFFISLSALHFVRRGGLRFEFYVLFFFLLILKIYYIAVNIILKQGLKIFL
jgi:hypothetical protein